MLSSEIRLVAGFASARRMMLMGFYNMALSKSRLAFMVTTEAEALRALVETRPGLLFATVAMEQGSGLALVEQAPLLVEDIRTILIVDSQQDDLVVAGRSKADGVVCEADCFGPDQAIITMIRTLALGQRYRSQMVLTAMAAAAEQRQCWRRTPPELSNRELAMVELLVEGLSDREIAARLQISYETARSRGKALRRKFSVTSRAQVVAKALQLGLACLGGGRRERLPDGPSPAEN